MKDLTTPSNLIEYKFRMKQDLKEKIKNSAKSNKRSMNDEIIYRLESQLKSKSNLMAVVAKKLDEKGYALVIFPKHQG